jgi:hypothetical protein
MPGRIWPWRRVSLYFDGDHPAILELDQGVHLVPVVRVADMEQARGVLAYREVTLDQTPQGYKDMDTRQALKVLVRPG